MLQTTQVDKTIFIDFIFQFLFITIQYQNYQIKIDKFHFYNLIFIFVICKNY